MKKTTSILAISVLGLLAFACGGPGDEPTSVDADTAEPGEPTAPPRPSIQDLYAAVQRNPGDPRAHHAFAMALHAAGRRDEAVTHFEKVAELAPQTPNLVQLGVAYASVSRPEDAETAFRRALETAPGHPVVLHHLGNLARGRGDVPTAVSLLQQATQNQPDYLMARFHLAETQRQAQQFQEAYRSYEAVVALEPTGPAELQAFDASLFHLASLDLQMGATERAVEILEVLVESVPEHPQAHLLLGQALFKLGRQEEGQEHLVLHQQIASRVGQPEGQPEATP